MKLPRGLVFTTDEDPGCTRRRRGRGFAYYDPKGRHITEPSEVQRFKALAVPPAYKEVWLCPLSEGHLQCTGKDARGRKQYRYHPMYRAFRDTKKFERLCAFGHALGAIRRVVDRELNESAPGEKGYASALVVKLLDRTGFRIGNECYFKENQTRGLITLSAKNVSIGKAAARMEFDFRTKGGKRISRKFVNKRLAARVRSLQDLPGQRLFVYLNSQGEYSPLGSDDVNRFLSEIAGESFTAKDFRTWIGTREAAAALARTKLVDDSVSEKSLQLAWREATKAASEALGNTVAVARDSYIHPALNSEAALAYFRQRRSKPLEALPRLTQLETALVDFLE